MRNAILVVGALALAVAWPEIFDLARGMYYILRAELLIHTYGAL